MTPDQLCLFLGLPVGTAVHAIRARVSSVASGDVRLGSNPERAAALRLRLGLSRTALAIAVLRVCESILRPRPLSRVPASLRGELHLGVVGARGATTFADLEASGVTLGELANTGLTIGELASWRPRAK